MNPRLLELKRKNKPFQSSHFIIRTQSSCLPKTCLELRPGPFHIRVLYPTVLPRACLLQMILLPQLYGRTFSLHTGLGFNELTEKGWTLLAFLLQDSKLSQEGFQHQNKCQMKRLPTRLKSKNLLLS
jgi:hypothetical protein